jgi:hypothetical protein
MYGNLCVNAIFIQPLQLILTPAFTNDTKYKNSSVSALARCCSKLILNYDSLHIWQDSFTGEQALHEPVLTQNRERTPTNSHVSSGVSTACQVFERP